ncbi:CoA transferase [Actinocorallia sp. A-T 12471]|uniref:CoA transferase n=1 Tax=Actinocorallia sp. A-T 12471 TaxID=3089813 RepID=UPI0029CED123|nr:CoA transferase [Actinocorallia sp. A-T 12471]MDX6743310.1 CoA transferase [Actinocorallia sp. A-T 12471]
MKDTTEEQTAWLCGLAELPPVPVAFGGATDLLPSVYQVGTVAAASVGAATAAAALLWELRGGPPAAATVDRGHAELAFLSERVFKIAGRPLQLWAELSGDYRTRDGWVRLHCNFPAHEAAALSALGCPPEPDAVARACAALDAVDVEEAVLAAGGAAAALRDRAEWAAFAHGPLLALNRIGDGPVVRPSAAELPLEGLRVLDLTRVIAGPVATRLLAAYGADVLHVGAPAVPEVPGLVLDMTFGKRVCRLDLKTPEGRADLRALVADADVLVQGYRPGALAALGFGPEDLRALNPSLVTVDVQAYEPGTPWAARRGFDSLVQFSTGIALESQRAADADSPGALPAQALDHATGYLGALAAMGGLVHRAASGGSWHGTVSLAATARWLDALGRTAVRPAGTPPDDVLAAMDSPHGVLSFVLPPGMVGDFRPFWATPPPGDALDPPKWR